MMATIYRSAETTFSWLGPEADDSTYAMKNILDMWQEILKHAKQLPPGTDVWSDPLSWLKPDQTDWFQSDLGGGDGYDAGTRNRFWSSARKLLARPYWKRAWVTQEIILSKMVLVVCGPGFIPCPCIWDVATWLCKIEGLPRPSFADEMLWRQLSTAFGRNLLGWTAAMDVIRLSAFSRRIQVEADKSGPKWPLVWRQLVVETQTQQATDPRDKLYSVLGLLNSNVVRPNYAHSAEDVFCDFAKLCIQADARLDHILMLAGHGLSTAGYGVKRDYPPQTLFVPSWVPNWDLISKESNLFYIQRKLVTSNVDGGRAIDPRPFWSFKGNALMAEGRSFDRVAMPMMMMGNSAKNWAFFCENILSRPGDSYVTGVPILQALTRFFFLDRHLVTDGRLGERPDPELMIKLGLFVFLVYSVDDWGIEPNQIWAHFGLTSMEAIWNKFVGHQGHGQHPTEKVSEELLEQTAGWIRGLASTRPPPGADLAERFRSLDSWIEGLSTEMVVNHILQLFSSNAGFVTDKGYLGWGPPGAEAGDLVCILECGLPVILKKVGSQYLHIGTCFVLGLEDGEGVRVAEKEGHEVQTFHIV
jgi:hypothetical protein